MVVSKILPVCYSKHSYHSYVFLELASFFFLQFQCQQIGSLHLTREKSGHVRNLSYGPEPNLDIYAVRATIQLMLGQEYGRANLLLLSTQIRRLLASESTSESHHSDVNTCENKILHLRVRVDQAIRPLPPKNT